MTHGETLDEFPYFFRSVTFSNDDPDVFAWCEDQFGPYTPEKEHSSTFTWCTSFKGYYFKEEKDYMLTLLRWS